MSPSASIGSIRTQADVLRTKSKRVASYVTHFVVLALGMDGYIAHVLHTDPIHWHERSSWLRAWEWPRPSASTPRRRAMEWKRVDLHNGPFVWEEVMVVARGRCLCA